MDSKNYIIRKKKIEDCGAVERVITKAWNETYKGIVPNDFLNNLYLNEEERIKRTTNNFNKKENVQYVLEVDNKIVGFIRVGPSNDKEYPYCGEIHALYIIKDYQRYGFGKKLIEAGIKELKSMNYNKMIIGCLVGNPSNEFYKHIGGTLIKTKIFKRLNLPENIYYFDKI